jgi:hypothetical protein
MKLTDEELMAYADGEMSAIDAKRVEAAMAADSALAARVARFRAVRRALHTAYDSVLLEPVPERLRALLGDVAASEPAPQRAPVDLAAHREKRQPRFGPPAWAAMAASLIIGVLAGRAVLPSGDLLIDNGRYAGADLTRVLDARLASDIANQSGATRVGLTFRARDGEICRTFSHTARADALSGLACREGERWTVQLAVHGGVQGEFRQAGADAPAILGAVDAMISGEPFDATQERASRDQNWAPVAQY